MVNDLMEQLFCNIYTADTVDEFLEYLNLKW